MRKRLLEDYPIEGRVIMGSNIPKDFTMMYPCEVLVSKYESPDENTGDPTLSHVVVHNSMLFIVIDNYMNTRNADLVINQSVSKCVRYYQDTGEEVDSLELLEIVKYAFKKYVPSGKVDSGLKVSNNTGIIRNYLKGAVGDKSIINSYLNR